MRSKHSLGRLCLQGIFMVLPTNQELGLPYEVKVYLRTPILAPPELKQIHPLGKVSHHQILTHKDLSQSSP